MDSQAPYQPNAPVHGSNDIGQYPQNATSQQPIHQEKHNSAPQYQQQIPQYHNGAEQKWHASYCDCCSPFDLCMKTWCCPCFVYGKTKHRLRSNGNMEGYDSMNSSCWLFCGAVCCGLTWVPIWMNRSDLRKKHNLEGNGCTDCLSACCCPLCDMVQQEKEAEAREAGGHGQPFVHQYQAQGGMAYPAPVQKH